MASFVIGDYRYTIVSSANATVRAQVVDNTKSSYDDIPPMVKNNNVYYTVTWLSNTSSGDGCFNGCTSLVVSPSIPSTVTNMYDTFSGCTSLTTPPEIPEGVTSMTACFSGCTSLAYAPVIPSSVQFMGYTFRGCSSLSGDIYIYTSTLSSTPSVTFMGTTQDIVLYSMNNNASICDQLASTADNGNVYVNVHPEAQISFMDTEMNYRQSSMFVPVALQTNASLVQCEVPDLVNDGTIITNVNDALIDLYKRGALGGAG